MHVSPLRAASAALFVLLAVPQADAQTSADRISIRLLSDRSVSSVALVASGSEMSIFAQPDREPVATAKPGDSVFVQSAPLGLRVEAGDLDINLDQLHARVSGDGTIDVAASAGGQVITRRYPGTIDVHASEDRTLHLTNTVPTETYVASVVGKEYGLDDVEGSRAMAVVARTFGVRALADAGGKTEDGINAQVYRGVDGITEASRSAAEATRGLVLSHEGRPIVAVYSSSNGGHSARNSDVWSGEPLPYLEARKDRFDRAASPYNDWLARLERDRVHRALADYTGAPVKAFSVESRSRDGRVREVRLRVDGGSDVTISGSEFRRVIAGRFGAPTLRSTLFQVEREGDHYVFEGSGYGHGVGLSQWGAHEMANRGYNYEEILRYYYPGTRLGSMDEIGFDAGDPVAVAATEEAQDDRDEPQAAPEPPRRRSFAAGVKGWTAAPGSAGGGSTGRDRVGW